MKTKKQVFWFLSLLALSFVSCTKDVDDEIKLLQSVVETIDGGATKTTSFSYQGSQIMTIDNGENLQEFTYTMGSITTIATTNKATSVKTSVTYSYDGGKLQTITSPNNYVIRYTHNADGSVAFEKFDISVENVETKIHHGTLTFDNGNLIEEERILDNQVAGVISTYVLSYEYDLKINPYSTIAGYDKLLDQGCNVSSNNYLVKTEENSIESNNQIISSATFYSNSFKYDNANYPTEKNSLVTNPDKGLSVNQKTVYKY